jgi:hypothetical protein
MKAGWLVAVTALVATSAARPPLLACGDKFLNLGFGTTYERSPAERRAAAVLLYAGTGTDLSRLLTSLAVDAGLRKQGYQPVLVSSAQELDAALRARQWHVILLDGRDAEAVNRRLPRPGGPQLVPVLAKPTKDELRLARKQYQTVLDTPTKPRVFVDVLDDALDHHELAARAAAKAARNAGR